MRKIIKPLLYVFSFIYGIIVYFRNMFYNVNILSSKEFHIPVISVGNITVGGTGKTPHTEYLIRLLKEHYKIAFLSRGYKRKTRDFVLSTEKSTLEEIGDEPLQIKQKFPDLTVAVDRKRVNGIEKLIELNPELDIVLLDDAYQHRHVTPGINILLVDYTRPIKGDSLLPLGRLREPASEKKRADIIIITKVPRNLSAMDKRLFLHDLDAKPYQAVYFTTIRYGAPAPIYELHPMARIPDFSQKDLSILLVTGIANPTPLLDKLSIAYKEVIHIRYPDHHVFSKQDISAIITKYNALSANNKAIVTTEKDAIRLLSQNYNDNIPEAWYYIPIETEFLWEEGEKFNRQIKHYVDNNSRNSILYK